MDGDMECARRLVTERCLIAADVDKTILSQEGEGERQGFLLTVGPKLLEAVSLGTHLALITGNSMDALSSRVLTWLIEELCHKDQLSLLSRFHFFCNSGGVYVRFPLEDKGIAKLLAAGGRVEARKALHELLIPASKPMAVRPRFIDPDYLDRSRIGPADAVAIERILAESAARYMTELAENRAALSDKYDLDLVSEKGALATAGVEMRSVEYGWTPTPARATVQITLRPVLSFRHARNPAEMFGEDMRGGLIRQIQSQLDSAGLGYYVARAGGRSSIDVTLEKLDKAYALEFLIDRLNLQGRVRSGQKFGSNTIYFGDEVINGGGNDYPVTRIPGLLVFAVNPDKDLVPLLHHVFVPSAILDGPAATADVVSQYNRCASKMLEQCRRSPRAKGGSTRTAIEVLKEEIFATRIKAKIASLDAGHHASVDDWQTLHAFVTLMCRDDPTSRQWLSILIGELDAIMTQLSGNVRSVHPALGTSHPDW